MGGGSWCWFGRRGSAEFFGKVLLQQFARLGCDEVLEVKLFQLLLVGFGELFVIVQAPEVEAHVNEQ